MKKLTVIISLMMLCACAFSQSLVGHLDKPKFKLSFDTTMTGPTWAGFRLNGPFVLYALPESTLYTGIGIDYEKDTYQAATNRYYTNYAIGVGLFAGGQFAPQNLQGAVAAGLVVQFFNRFLSIGLLYNFTTKKAQGAIGSEGQLIPNN